MNGIRFTKDFVVRYYEINNKQEATPIALLNYLEETAICHSESIGFGIGTLLNIGMGWVLNKWHVNMERYPKWNEKIVIETWPSSFERFYANREFRITDSEGIEIGRASSLWIFLNILKKRPVRIPEEIANSYGIESTRVLEAKHDFSNLVIDEEGIDFYVRRSDIDTNNHVNNTKYLEWFLEAIPNEIYMDYMLMDFEIHYKKETVYGSSVLSNCCSIENEAEYKSYSHSITDKDKKIELALAKTSWQKRRNYKNI